MKTILLLNGSKAFGASGAKLNEALHGTAKETLEILCGAYEALCK